MHGRWFWAWAFVDFAAALGFVSLGVLMLLPVLVVGGALAHRPSSRSSAFGLLTGAGLVLIFVAWLQRDGPGTTCWQTATASGCDEHLSPLPWVAAGLVLIVAGLVGQARRR